MNKIAKSEQELTANNSSAVPVWMEFTGPETSGLNVYHVNGREYRAGPAEMYKYFVALPEDVAGLESTGVIVQVGKKSAGGVVQSANLPIVGEPGPEIVYPISKEESKK